MASEIISYLDMCPRDGVSPQRDSAARFALGRTVQIKRQEGLS